MLLLFMQAAATRHGYCSTACKEEHWNHGQIGAACCVPHRLICPTLSFFGSSKCDADMDSVLHMCLDALALQTLQHPEAGSARLPCRENAPYRMAVHAWLCLSRRSITCCLHTAKYAGWMHSGQSGPSAVLFYALAKRVRRALKIPRRRSDQSTGTSCSCKISPQALAQRIGRTGSRRAASCAQPSPRPAGRDWPPLMRRSCPTLAASCPTTLGDAFATQPALNSWLAPHEVKCSDCGLSPISGGNPVKKCQCRYMLCGPLIKAMSCAQDIWLW